MAEVKKSRPRRIQALTSEDILTQNLTEALRKGSRTWGFEDNKEIKEKVADLKQIDSIKYMNPKWVAAAMHIIATHSTEFNKAASTTGLLPTEVFDDKLFEPYWDTFNQERKAKKTKNIAITEQRFKFMIITYCQRIFTRIYLKDTIPFTEEIPTEEGRASPQLPTSPQLPSSPVPDEFTENE